MRAGWWAALGLLSGLCACTGPSPRDKNYGKDAGTDFEAPAADGSTDTGGDGAAGSAATATGGGGGSDASGGAAGAAGAAGDPGGNAGNAGTSGQAGGNGGTAGQAGAAGAGGGAAGATALGPALPDGVALACLTSGPPTSRKDWTAAPRATKMHLDQVSSTWPWGWTTVIDTRGGGPSGLRPQPMES